MKHFVTFAVKSDISKQILNLKHAHFFLKKTFFVLPTLAPPVPHHCPVITKPMFKPVFGTPRGVLSEVVMTQMKEAPLNHNIPL